MSIFTECKIETDRLILRPYSKDDTHGLHEIANNSDVLRFLPDEPLTLEEIVGVIEWSIDCNTKNKEGHIVKFNLSTIDKKSGKVIGWCGLGPADWNRDETELYYTLKPEFWGKGLATECAKALVHFMLTEAKVKRIVAEVDPKHKASIKVLEKIGMKYDGVIREIPSDCDLYFMGHKVYSIES